MGQGESRAVQPHLGRHPARRPDERAVRLRAAAPRRSGTSCEHHL
jgi:hypothetical protein